MYYLHNASPLLSYLINLYNNAAAIILLLVVLFLFVLLYGVRFLSNKKMLEDEDRAKHSSNYQGE